MEEMVNQGQQDFSQTIPPKDLAVSGQESTLSDSEKWASIVGGGAMVLMGLQQRSLRGVLMAIAGGGMVYHGATSDTSITHKVSEAVGINKSIRVEKTVTINKSAEELYSFWHNFENLPHFMKHLQAVTVLDDRRSHWVAKAPMGQDVEWDAEIVKDEPNHLIAWTSVEEADVENSGFVRFQPAPADRGTEVKVVIEYAPPGGALTAVLAKFFGEEPEQQIGDDLRRFKQLMEAGEIATTEGQPTCRG
ncbi:MAG: SRPBCC family protein [Oculatellaceae cyanobacterium bins.114]|nr:SRPBCC family protein [Oculatellaceae cyanobacterium bins.114]